MRLDRVKRQLGNGRFWILAQNATCSAHITLISNLSHRNTKNIAVINTTKQRVDYFFFWFRLLMYLHPIWLNHTTLSFFKLHYIPIKTSLTAVWYWLSLKSTTDYQSIHHPIVRQKYSRSDLPVSQYVPDIHLNVEKLTIYVNHWCLKKINNIITYR